MSRRRAHERPRDMWPLQPGELSPDDLREVDEEESLDWAHAIERCGHGHQIGDCPDPRCWASHQSAVAHERDD